MKLSIIIVNFNTSELLEDCVASIFEHAPRCHSRGGGNLPNVDPRVKPEDDNKHCHFEIIVVNNSSDPKESEILKSLYGSRPTASNCNIKLLDVENHGFGSAINAGAKIAKGEYLLLLNPDTLAVDNSIDKMLGLLKSHDEIGALSPLLYGKDGETLQEHIYGNFQSLLSVTFRRWRGKNIDRGKEIVYADIISGAAMMTSAELFKRLNGFDERFFMYLEDDDFCFRIKELGLKCAVYTQAKIIHLEGKSQNNRKRKNIYYDSQTKYWYKHNGVIATALMRILRYPYRLLKADK